MDSGNAAELDLDKGWSIGEDAFRMLVRNLRELAPRRIVEFGSGASSIRLALEFPKAQLISIESDPEYLARVVRLKAAFAPDSLLEVSLRKFRWRRFGLGLYLTYEAGDFFESIDAVIIDGPPGWTRRGREACLYQVFDRVRRGGRIYLDDFNRRDEQRIVKNWITALPGGLAVSVLEAGNLICVLEKIEVSTKRRSTPGMVMDNMEQNLRHLWRKLKPSKPGHWTGSG